MPLPTSAFIAWITTALGWDTRQEYGAPVIQGPYILDEPDKVIHVTAVPAPGYVMEGAADASAFQARVRGPQNDPAGAEQLAYALDALVFGASFPVPLNSGQTLIHVHRLGGGPTPLGPPDDGDRQEFVTSYVCIAST